LRVSIDGAFPQNYEKYRLGGSLPTALEFLRQLHDDRRRRASRLEVEWKYILFEWNDSEEEMRHAARLAEDLDVWLRFTLTHSPGKSKRFPDIRSLAEALPRIAPDAGVDLTFQLKEPDKCQDVGFVVSEHVAALFSSSINDMRHGDEKSAVIHMGKALRRDPGIEPLPGFCNVRRFVRKHYFDVLQNAKFPSTLSSFAAVCSELGFNRKSVRLLRRYLDLAPNTTNRTAVLATIESAGEFRNSDVILWLRTKVRLRTRLRHVMRVLKHFAMRQHADHRERRRIAAKVPFRS